MLKDFKEIGGAEIGDGHGTYPFASLQVTRYSLQVTLSLIGTVIFRPSDVISIELHNAVFGIKRGISIKHKVGNYSDRIIFRPIGTTARLLHQIQQTGFLLNCDPLPESIERRIMSLQSSGSFPIKTSAGLTVIMIWLVACAPSLIKDSGWLYLSGFPATLLLPFGLLLLFCLTLLCVPGSRKFMLKRHHDFKEIRAVVIFILCILCFFLIPITVLLM